MKSKKAFNQKEVEKSFSVKKPKISAAIVASKAPTPAKPVPTPIATKDSNLKKLAESSIVSDFVKSKDGCWNHQDWLSFLADLKEKGCDPIDPEQVGLLLEEKKSQYLAAKG